MGNNIFAFTLCTESDLSGATLFSDTGEVIGRILNKSGTGNDESRFFYDIESSKEYFKKLESGQIKVYGVDAYSVSVCNIWYTRSEKC